MKTKEQLKDAIEAVERQMRGSKNLDQLAPLTVQHRELLQEAWNRGYLQFKPEDQL